MRLSSCSHGVGKALDAEASRRPIKPSLDGDTDSPGLTFRHSGLDPESESGLEQKPDYTHQIAAHPG